MNEEELFCKLFPEYAVNGKPLSPYFDLFESGYEQSEKRISELEKENAELKEDNSEWEKTSDKWKSVYELTNNQLANAKEIIREFMKYEINEYDGSLEIHFEELKVLAQNLEDTEICENGWKNRVRELKAQIEKMKCCENCQHWEGREPIPSLAEKGYYCFNDYPFECKRWELAEELRR